MTTINADSTNICPCQSGKKYGVCCRIIHQDQQKAELPEQLMRARYSAYVLCKKDFILGSWAFETRPEVLTLKSETRWFTLEIVDSEPVSAQSTSAYVSFIAKYIEDNRVFNLEEQSTFIKRSNRWFYLSGVSRSVSQKLGGKAKCPCGSGKKFKRCCLQDL
jgi:SEC-C motif-containing protein